MSRINYILPFIVFGILTIITAQTISRNLNALDFNSFYYGSKSIQAGKNPYDHYSLLSIAEREGETRVIPPYVYPPPFAIALIPLTMIEVDYATLIWRVINFISFLLTFYFLIDFVRRETPDSCCAQIKVFHQDFNIHILAISVTSILLLYPIQTNIKSGRVDIQIVLLQSLFLAFGTKNWFHHNPVILGIASFAKFIPAFFAALYVIQKEYRRLLGFSAIVIFVVFLSVMLRSLTPWEQFFDLSSKNVYGSSVFNIDPRADYNVSLSGFLSQHLGLGHPTIAPISYIISFGLLLVLLFNNKYFYEKKSISFFILGITTMSLLSLPFLWIPHSLLLMPGIASSLSTSWIYKLPKRIPYGLILFTFLAQVPYSLIASNEYFPLSDSSFFRPIFTHLNFVSIFALFFLSISGMVALNLKLQKRHEQTS